jgi:hypothetical protein
MNKIIRLEEVMFFIIGVYAYTYLDYSWGLFFLLLFSPDISMIGYIWNTKLGAYTYNIVHHRGIGLGILLVGVILSQSILLLVGIILFTHSSMDRVFGYGLKHIDSFKHTDLGTM